MFRSLRARLVLSHILPLIVVVPLMSLALAYLLETRFLLPKLAEDLLDDARLLTQVTRADYLVYGDQANIQLVLLRLALNPQVRLVYLQPDGKVIYSNDPDFLARAGQKIDVPGLERAQAGEEVVSTNYSLLTGSQYSIHVLAPVIINGNQPVGILWMTYYEASLTRLFEQIRLLTILAVIGGLLVGTLLGSVLAFNIGRPIRRVTQAIHSLAEGERSEVLLEQGPDEIRDLVRQVNVLVTRLHSLEQARRQLLANLVHELGRPLGALRSAIQALARGAGEDPQLLQDLTTGMDEETARLQDILNDLAHLHDQVLGSLELKREPVALSDWLPRVLLSWGEAAAEKRLIWQIDIPDNLPAAQIDQVRFAQVIGNLASNAVKFTPPGGEVHISAGQNDGELWICVRDTGPGIPVVEQEKIFQPFFQGSQGRRLRDGMGLGLSIAHDLISAHEGRISIESAPGEGSTFTVWVPAAGDQKPEASNQPTEPATQ
jgi:two-component system, OmpR family, sensor histidine kinase BaeS